MSIVVATVVNSLELRGASVSPTKMEDWRSGKDFQIVGGPYCSNRDLTGMKEMGFDILEFTNHDGTLVERIVINDALELLVSEGIGTFNRIT
jgi:hypothetical protein